MTPILNAISSVIWGAPQDDEYSSISSNDTVSSRSSQAESVREEPVQPTPLSNATPLKGRVRELTYMEEAAKAVAKAIVLIAFITLGSFLGSLISIPVPFVGAAIGGGVAFTAAMKVLEKVDKYFENRTFNKLEHQ